MKTNKPDKSFLDVVQVSIKLRTVCNHSVGNRDGNKPARHIICDDFGSIELFDMDTKSAAVTEHAADSKST